MILLLAQAALVFLACALGQALALWVALWPLRRAGPEAHWSERARLAWSARLLISLGPLVAAVAVGTQAESFSPLEVAHPVLSLAAFLGGTATTLRPASRLLQRRVTWKSIAVDYLVAFFVLRGALLAMLLMLVALVGQTLGPTAIAIMAGGFAVVCLLQFGATFPLWRLFGLLAPPPPRLWEAVAAVADRAGMELPAVYLMRWNAANAFAFIYARAVAFTSPCVELLSDEELQSIAAHELAHLRETTRQKLARGVAVLLIFPFFTFPVWVERYGFGALLVILLIVLVTTRLFRSFGQRMERQADAAAHADTAGEGIYARTLEKLHQHNSVPAVMRGKAQTHPHLYDRLLAAGVQPAYPRPQAPRIWLLWPTLAIVVAMSQTPRLLHLRRVFHGNEPVQMEDSVNDMPPPATPPSKRRVHSLPAPDR